MIADISLLESSYYPYHLSWEELNNPGMVMQGFIQKWDLQHARILLKRWQGYISTNSLIAEQPDYDEIKMFLQDLEKLIEAVFVMRVQQEMRIKSKISLQET